MTLSFFIKSNLKKTGIFYINDVLRVHLGVLRVLQVRCFEHDLFGLFLFLFLFFDPYVLWHVLTIFLWD